MVFHLEFAKRKNSSKCTSITTNYVIDFDTKILSNQIEDDSNEYTKPKQVLIIDIFVCRLFVACGTFVLSDGQIKNKIKITYLNPIKCKMVLYTTSVSISSFFLYLKP